MKCPYCAAPMDVNFDHHGVGYLVFAECAGCNSQGPPVYTDGIPSYEDQTLAMTKAERRDGVGR